MASGGRRQRRVGHHACRLLVLSLLPVLTVGHVLAKEAGDCPVSYQSATDLLTIEANAIPLNRLLGCIAERTNIQVVIPPFLERPITLTTTVPSVSVFATVLGEENYVIFYEGKGAMRRVSRVAILPKGTGAAVSTTATAEPEAGPVEATTEPSVYTAEQRAELRRQQAERETQAPGLQRIRSGHHRTNDPRRSETPGEPQE